MAAAPYVGNNDFRGYLSYLAQNGDSQAADALHFVGNQVGAGVANNGFDPNAQQSFYDSPDKNRSADLAANQKYITGLYNSWANPTTAVLGTSATGGAPAKTTAQLQDEFNTGLSGITGYGTDAYSGEYTKEHNSGQNLIDSLTTGQKGVDTSRENNELNRLNGIQDILGFVRNGLQSGASRLAQMNATDSSGNEALARAYNKVGAGRSNDVNNQAVIAGRTIDTNQDALNLQRTRGLSDLADNRSLFNTSTGSTLRDKLTTLRQQGIDAGIGGQIDPSGIASGMVNTGTSRLAPIDAWLQSMLGGINPEASDSVHANAVKLQSTGYNTPNPFTTGLPTNGGSPVSGPAISDLPIFTGAPKRQLA